MMVVAMLMLLLQYKLSLPDVLQLIECCNFCSIPVSNLAHSFRQASICMDICETHRVD